MKANFCVLASSYAAPVLGGAPARVIREKTPNHRKI
jgi:hypothetical protein